MIFFNDRKLARLLRDGALSERQQFPYFVALILYAAAVGTTTYIHAMANPGQPPTIYEHIVDLTWIIGQLLALLLSYRANENGDGRAFIARYVCLGFPVMVATTAIALIFGLAGMYIDDPAFLSGDGTATMGPAACAGVCLATLYLVYRLPTAMKIAAALRGAGPGTRPWGTTHSDSRPAPAVPLASGPGPGLLPLLHNLKHGARAAFMNGGAAAQMHFSWHAFVFIIGVYVLLANIIDYAALPAPRTFNSYAIPAECARFMLLLAGAYGACVVFLRPERTLSFAVALCNMALLPWLILSLLLTSDMAWTDDYDNREALMVITAMWLYIASFRLLTAFFGAHNMRATLAAGVVIVALSVPVYHFYIPPFWYEATAENQAAADPGPSALDRASHENLFARQSALVAAELSTVPASAPGVTDIYAVVFGGDGQQNVFRRETSFVADTLARTYGLHGQVVTLLNHPSSVDKTPLATATNLDAIIAGLAKKMQAEDIIMLYMTSHGSIEEGLAIALDGNLRFDRVDGPRIRAALDASAIKNRVVILSACYSGSMMDALKTEHSLIITAAAPDRPSFGCADDAELTYFADALFKHALPREPDLVKAFTIAEAHIHEREMAEGIEEASRPQIHVGPAIEAALQRHRPPAPPAIHDNKAAD